MKGIVKDLNEAQLDPNVEVVIAPHRSTCSIKVAALNVFNKRNSAFISGIGIIRCCGELLEERMAGKTLDVITKQLEALHSSLARPEAWKSAVVTYEPIWAIDTGKVASNQQAQEVHEAIRKWLKEARTWSEPDLFPMGSS
ncbi:Triosephosphate isomerase [Phialemonium atrogriseum]|uniref:Triosephosphate isomerase n=1 Tax=Phialemonium atrogriseum TaxID=1093897 RepID=A0AAJ0FJU1_9PEZI|nr:Triosephosphate isomerase [Phialemonium atrogriseum]KAK1765703.1 Triosephosphate isomerase [Phialemonium atrogriseum]